MCRLAAYAGPARPLSALLYDGSHSLEVQAYLPREMRSGHVNVDGTGLVWWPEGSECEPLRYVTERPPWSDANLPDLAPRLSARVQLGAVRSATPGMPFGAAAVGPFAGDGLGFAHNGFIADFESGPARALTSELSDAGFARTASRTDSTVLFELIRDERERAPEAGPLVWLEAGLDRAIRAVRAAGSRANLTCVLSDGRTLAAVRRAVDLEPNTLYARIADDELWLASEPLDDGDWAPLAPDVPTAWTLPNPTAP